MEIIMEVDPSKPCSSCGEAMQISACWPTKRYEYNWEYNYCINTKCDNYWGKTN